MDSAFALNDNDSEDSDHQDHTISHIIKNVNIDSADYSGHVKSTKEASGHYTISLEHCI